ncbi:MAG: tRNA 2-thiocytidine biosynthesis protein TtcA [Ruminococcus sp.]|nr:tRNA 2-thiocytidine biosynthesis protein TtcA [Ruminococcus sp.]
MIENLSVREKAEQSITKKYRKKIWAPFIRAVKQYELISEGDKIAVCISGGKDSMLMAKLIELLKRYTEVPFEAVYIVMDPGYNKLNREKIESNARLLNIPIEIFETDIFDITDKAEKYPCYLCARMRRGHLYKKAKELGCNKIALGHHFSDVIETTVMAMFYGSQLQGMIPKLHSQNYGGMELIRPMYCIHEDDIIAWCRYNGLEFIRCACRITEKDEDDSEEFCSKRKEIKELIRELKKTNPNIEKSIFNSIHAVNIETFPAFKKDGEIHSFLETYNEK